MQEDWKTKEQRPLEAQQVPGGGQGLGWQEPPMVHAPEQAAWSVGVHAPVVAQHVPG